MHSTMIVAVAKESLALLANIVNQFASNQMSYDEMWAAIEEVFDTDMMVYASH